MKPGKIWNILDANAYQKEKFSYTVSEELQKKLKNGNKLDIWDGDTTSWDDRPYWKHYQLKFFRDSSYYDWPGRGLVMEMFDDDVEDDRFREAYPKEVEAEVRYLVASTQRSGFDDDRLQTIGYWYANSKNKFLPDLETMKHVALKMRSPLFIVTTDDTLTFYVKPSGYY